MIINVRKLQGMITFRVCSRFHLRRARWFSTTAACRSGHNRWSKIKHDKAKVDASVTKERSVVAEELYQSSKEDGPDPQMNPRLADIITKAKKIGFPKVSIESAIARGQGVSLSGAALVNVTVEAMIPPGVAVIIEGQTDSKLRTLSDIRLAVKEAGGMVSPTNHLFDRKGRVVIEKHLNVGESEIFDRAVEAGAIDVEVEEDGDVVVSTESNQTAEVAKALSQSLGAKVKSSDIIWVPKEDMMVEPPSPQTIWESLDRIHNVSSVQDIYTNLRPSI